ncbi:antigen A [Listeria monocytogenes]|nr:antigen A [Listeria monocytogenes]GAT38190.1 antigen A [Listeria monocytogenes]GAT41037.1 antigen A [Listeria monocytogenes]
MLSLERFTVRPCCPATANSLSPAALKTAKITSFPATALAAPGV